MNIRKMHFHDRNGKYGEGLTDTVAVVSPRTGIDHHRVNVGLVSSVDSLAHRPFVVRLERLDHDFELGRQCLDARIDLRERHRPVVAGSRLPNMLRLMPCRTRIFICDVSDLRSGSDERLDHCTVLTYRWVTPLGTTRRVCSRHYSLP